MMSSGDIDESIYVFQLITNAIIDLKIIILELLNDCFLLSFVFYQ